MITLYYLVLNRLKLLLVEVHVLIHDTKCDTHIALYNGIRVFRLSLHILVYKMAFICLLVSAR